jgi:hypothetical protein
MSPPARPADRREPVPGLFGLPGHLLRQLSPRWRRAAIGTAVVLVVAAVVTAIVLGPQIADSNRERAAEQRRAERQAQAEELARLRAEQRPRTGTVAAASSAALVAGVERAITRDAQARQATGELETRASRTDCRVLRRETGRLRLGCTAVTSDIEGTDDVRGVMVGYPYRAALSLDDGRYALCKTSGRPGEGSFTRRAPVEVPRACGG